MATSPPAKDGKLAEAIGTLGLFCVPSALAGVGVLVAELMWPALRLLGFSWTQSTLAHRIMGWSGLAVAILAVPGLRYFFLRFPSLYVRAVRNSRGLKRVGTVIGYPLLTLVLLYSSVFALVLILPPALLTMAALESLFRDGFQWWLAVPAFVASVPPLVLAVMLIRRALRMRSVSLHTELLATSRARGAAAGIVELRGIARAAKGHPEGAPLLQGWVRFLTPELPASHPFDLEDASGRIRVEPPADAAALLDGRIDLPLTESDDATGGTFALNDGDEIFAVGRLEVDETNGERVRVLRPVRSAAGLVAGAPAWLRHPFEAPELFLVTTRGERAVRRRLRSRWISEAMQAVPWGAGGLTVVLYVLLVTLQAAGLCVGPCRSAQQDPFTVLAERGESYAYFVALRALEDWTATGNGGPTLSDEFVNGLTSESFDARRLAAKALAGIRPVSERAVPGLLKLLEDDRVHDDAAAALGNVPLAAWIADARERLRSADARVRDRTVVALGKTGWQGPGAVSDVVRAMRSDPSSAIHAIFALEALAPAAATEAVPALIAYARETTREAYMRGYAVAALERFKPPSKETIDLLVEFVADVTHPVDKQRVIHALWVLGGDANRAIPALAVRAAHGFVDAADAIAKLAPYGPGDVDLMLPALDGENSQLRENIARSLGRYGKPAAKAVPKLITLLDDGSWPVQKAARDSLVVIAEHHPQSVALLIPMLDSERDYGRIYAAEVLGTLALRSDDVLSAVDAAAKSGTQRQKSMAGHVRAHLEYLRKQR